MRKKRLCFTVSCTSTAMPFFLSRASTDGSIRSRRAPVPSTRISARKSRLQVKCASSLKLMHNRQCFKQSSSKKSNESEDFIWNCFNVYSIIRFIFCLGCLFFFTYSWFNHMEKWDALLCDVSMAADLQTWKNTGANQLRKIWCFNLTQPIKRREGSLKAALTFHWRMAGGSTAHGPSTMLPSMLKPCEL